MDENWEARHGNDEPMDHKLADHLIRLESLKDVVFIGYWYELVNADGRIRMPLLTNLRTLVLLNLRRPSIEPSHNVEDIAEILLESPGLTSLGLSLDMGINFDNDMLRKLINYYRSRRESLRKPLLRLSKLHLDYGYLPVNLGKNFPEEDYLVHLTDLGALTSLRLDNWHRGDFHSVRKQLCEISANIFSRATQVRRITVERLSSDILTLINTLKSSSSKPDVLDEIEVSRYFETLQPANNPIGTPKDSILSH